MRRPLTALFMGKEVPMLVATASHGAAPTSADPVDAAGPTGIPAAVAHEVPA